MITRRSFLTSSFALTASALGSCAYREARITTSDLKLTKNEIFIPKLASAFDGFKIGLVSDPHIGSCTNSKLLAEAINLLSNENLDLLVLAGDYILILDLMLARFFYSRYSESANTTICTRKIPSFEESLEQGMGFFNEVAKQACRLNPKHGIVAVLGNHDRWNSAENCQKIFSENGIDLLVNRSVDIVSSNKILEIYGSDDYSTGVPIAPIGHKSTRILVSHNPDFLSELSTSEVFELGLAGHTHGGQINLPLLGPLGLNTKDHRLIQGLTNLSSSQIYVSSGIGTSGLPWRINCPPEVNILTLRS